LPRLDYKKQKLTCTHHPERAGYGICRRCDTSFCDECAAFLDGILTCPACTQAIVDSEDTGLIAVGDSPIACAVVLVTSLAGTTLTLYGLTQLIRF